MVDRDLGAQPAVERQPPQPAEEDELEQQADEEGGHRAARDREQPRDLEPATALDRERRRRMERRSRPRPGARASPARPRRRRARSPRAAPGDSLPEALAEFAAHQLAHEPRVLRRQRRRSSPSSRVMRSTCSADGLGAEQQLDRRRRQHPAHHEGDGHDPEQDQHQQRQAPEDVNGSRRSCAVRRGAPQAVEHHGAVRRVEHDAFEVAAVDHAIVEVTDEDRRRVLDQERLRPPVLLDRGVALDRLERRSLGRPAGRTPGCCSARG